MFYSTNEIAAKLGVSVLRIRQIAKARNIPHYKKCGRSRFYLPRYLELFALRPTGRPKKNTTSSTLAYPRVKGSRRSTIKNLLIQDQVAWLTSISKNPKKS